MEGSTTRLTRLLGPVERGIFRVARIEPTAEQGWLAYAGSFVIFTLASIGVLYLLQRAQDVLPLNPTGAGSVASIWRSIRR